MILVRVLSAILVATAAELDLEDRKGDPDSADLMAFTDISALDHITGTVVVDLNVG